MWNDEIVEEVRRVREEFAAKYNYDISAMCVAIREYEKANGIKTISRPPRVPEPAVGVETLDEVRKVA